MGVDELRVVEDHAVHGSAHPQGGAEEQLTRDVRDGVAAFVAPVHVPQQAFLLTNGQEVLHGCRVVLTQLLGQAGVPRKEANRHRSEEGTVDVEIWEPYLLPGIVDVEVWEPYLLQGTVDVEDCTTPYLLQGTVEVEDRTPYLLQVEEQ